MAGHTDREIVGTTAGAVDELEPELRATLYEALLDLPEDQRSHSRTERAIARRRRRRSRLRIAVAGLVAMAGVIGVIVATGTPSDDAPAARPSALVSTQEDPRPAETATDDQPPTTATETPAPVASETTAPGSSGDAPPDRDGSRRRTPRRTRPAAPGSGPAAAVVAGIATERPTSTNVGATPTTATTAPPSTSTTTSSTSTTTTTTTTSPPVEPPPEPPPVP